MAERVAEGKVSRMPVMGDSKQAGQFALEVAERPQAGLRSLDVVERPGQQIVQRGIRMFRFHGGFEELAAIRGQQGGGVVFPQALTPLADGNLSQPMQFAAASGLHGDFPAEEQVELASKRTLRAACPFGHGFHQSVFLGEPVHDQAGICQPGEADQDGPGRLHPRSVGKRNGISDGKPKAKIV